MVIGKDNIEKARCKVIMRITSNLNEENNTVSICTSVKVICDY
jgi:hypothetical protein